MSTQPRNIFPAVSHPKCVAQPRTLEIAHSAVGWLSSIQGSSFLDWFGIFRLFLSQVPDLWCLPVICWSKNYKEIAPVCSEVFSRAAPPIFFTHFLKLKAASSLYG